MKRKNILIICRSKDDLKLLSKIKPNNKNYILASDSIGVQKSAIKYLFISKTTFIEKKDSFHNVSSDVIKFVDKINIWFKKTSGRFAHSNQNLFWDYQAEGGQRTQVLQDVLLLIKSYENLLNKHNFKKLILLNSSNHNLENKLLIDFCNSKNINLQKINKINLKNMRKNLRNIIILYLIDFVYIVNIFIKKIFYPLKMKSSKNNLIAIKMCGAQPKHYNEILPFSKALTKKEYNVDLLHWGVSFSFSKINSKKINIILLEKWLPIKSLIASIVISLFTLISIKSKKKSFINSDNLQYKGISFGKLLWPSIIFSVSHASQLSRLKSSIERYSKKNSVSALKFCTITNQEDLTIYNSLRNKQFLKIWWPTFPLFSSDPYLSQAIPVDLSLVTTKYHIKHLKSLGIQSENFSIIGGYSLKSLSGFKNKFSQADSLEKLQIRKKFKKYICFDYGVVLRGYYTFSEAITLLTFLSKLCISEDYCLIIKPHPSANIDKINTFLKSFSSNVFIVNRDSLPYHSINACDLLITKYSMIGVDAMIFKKPVISVILDKELGFKAFKNAAEYVFSIKDLDILFKKFKENPDFYENWKNSQLEKSSLHINKIYKSTKIDSYEKAAESIEKLIKKLK